MIRSEIDWINAVRRAELDILLAHVTLPPGDLLEIGGGSGYQAGLLQQRSGMRVISIDIAASAYRNSRVFPVQDYDGRLIPFPDASFDAVFSSNTLEHIAELDAFEAEIARVLRPGGCAIHILPTHRWRLWSWLAHYPGLIALAARRSGRPPETPSASPASAGSRLPRLLAKVLFSPRHGERGNSLTEYRYFHPRWWEAHFIGSGWRLRESFDLGLFYTGYMLTRDGLGMPLRRRLGRIFGGATQCYVLDRKR